MRRYQVRKLVIVVVQHANVYRLDIVILKVSAAHGIVCSLSTVLAMHLRMIQNTAIRSVACRCSRFTGVRVRTIFVFLRITFLEGAAELATAL